MIEVALNSGCARSCSSKPKCKNYASRDDQQHPFGRFIGHCCRSVVLAKRCEGQLKLLAAPQRESAERESCRQQAGRAILRSRSDRPTTAGYRTRIPAERAVYLTGQKVVRAKCRAGHFKAERSKIIGHVVLDQIERLGPCTGIEGGKHRRSIEDALQAERLAITAAGSVEPLQFLKVWMLTISAAANGATNPTTSNATSCHEQMDLSISHL